MQERYHIGDLKFAKDADGTAFDIVIMAGLDIFLILNNTRMSLNGVARCETWSRAQLPLVKLAELFSEDPLELR
jgi:hypothetical protein